MKVGFRLLPALLFTPLLAFSAVPLQPKLEIRLQDYLTSYKSRAGTPFRCVVIRGLEIDRRIEIPEGSTIYGSVHKATKVGLGIVHERAGLDLSFDEYETPSGRRFPLTAQLFSIDNSRERVSKKGHIKGVLAANNPGNLLNGFWFKPSTNIVFRSMIGLTGAANQVWEKYSMGPIGAAGLFAVRCFIVAFPEPEIYLPPGTDMKLTVRMPPASAPETEVSPAPDENSAQAVEELSGWVKERLGPISFGDGRPAPDLFNVIVFGSRQEIVSAFTVSGWQIADHRSLLNSSHMYEAFSSMRGYDAAPVSKLLYKGMEPDLVFEKSLDTITQRHHVRFWKLGIFDGQEVWLGAATHDTGVKFKLRSMSFTHKIDTDIDPERDKVSTDLSFAGCSDTPIFLDGTAESPAYKSGKAATDGRIAVLVARPCVAPASVDDAPGAPGNKFSRLTRRVILETRNYLLRDNVYYWGYQMIRSRTASRHAAE